ncbi:conserved eukaryotic protein [Lentinula edodes]|uniref:Conserved eukaryotic protein n=1 Tax=Lentinula edodes TaxID=5353 RepID=A0A1Q3E4G2_LENED|nr:conserved eukaryotic protein [Lentinula edodes]
MDEGKGYSSSLTGYNLESSKSLKNALNSQQSRLKVKEKASHAAEIAEQKARKLAGGPSASSRSKTNQTTGQRNEIMRASGKGKRTLPSTQKPTIPFQPTDTILLIGEEYYCNCLEWNTAFKGRRWSKIVWNFPHAGKGINDQDRNILSNQTLILGFLHSAAKFLKQGPVPSVAGRKKQKASDEDEDEGEETDNDTRNSLESGSCRGTILITLRNVPPYTLWDVPKLAKNPPSSAQGSTSSNPRYIILRSFAFHREIWDGYEHRMTKGLRAHGTGKTGEGGEDRTWEFCLRDIPDV